MICFSFVSKMFHVLWISFLFNESKITKAGNICSVN